MNIVFNRYNEPIQGHVYLGTPNGKILCAINGIEESTFQLTSKFNNTFELTFDLNENILIQDGKGLSKLVHSNVYDLVDGYACLCRKCWLVYHGTSENLLTMV